MLDTKARPFLAQPNALTPDISYFAGGRSFPPGKYDIVYVGGSWRIDPTYPWWVNSGVLYKPLLITLYSETELGVPFSSMVEAEVWAANRADPLTSITLDSPSPIGVQLRDTPCTYYNNSNGQSLPSWILVPRSAS